MGQLEQAEAEAAAVAKTENRVTLDSIKAKVLTTQLWQPPGTTLTIAVVTLKNGFQVVGKSAAADPLNFNRDLGEKFAIEDAIRQAWPLEAYLLREAMSVEQRMPE